ncbi:MAG: ribonuclease HII, partial [Patescibacteria group bacterium]
DSKQLSTKQRELIFEKIKQEPSIEWKVSFVGPSVIDKINILQATKLAWKNCLKKLDSQPDFLFIDGNQGIKKLNIEQQTIIKGDQKIFLVSLASIIAKVSRDKLMERLDLKYPEYNFKQHKGYGTKLHLKNLKKFGPCTIHRKSFRPICKI